MAPPPDRSAERQSWKKRSSVDQPSTTKSRRWVMTLLAVGLLVFLIWLIYPRQPARVQFVSLEVNDYAKRIVPQLPSDVRALDTTTNKDSALRFLNFTDLSEALDEPTLDGLSSIETICSQNDRLVVYLSAHLVPASDGQVDILLRNYVGTADPGTSIGRYPLSDLLQRMKASVAGVKLLLIDSGRLTIDPRLSLLGNSAYHLLDQQLVATDDESLGIIVSTQPCESACGWYGRPQSFFGQAVVEAFKGHADDDNDTWLTVEEVYEYIARQCHYHSGKSQTPVLLTSRGNAEDLIAQRLFALEERESDDEIETAGEPAEAESTEQPPDNDQTPNEGTSEEDTSEQPAAGAPDPSSIAESDDASKSDAPAGKVADNDNEGGRQDADTNNGSRTTEPYLQLIDRAWALRDNLIAKRSALVAAPHLCRELDSHILDFELRFHGSSPDYLTSVELKHLIDSLETLVRHGRVDTNHLLGERFADGLRAFSSSAEHSSILTVQRCSYLARDYVDWHGKVAYFVNDADLDDFANAVQSLLGLIVRFRESLPNENATVTLSDAQERKLRKSSRDIQTQQRNVHNKWIKLIQRAARNADSHRDQCMIEATLGSRLPAAELRAELRRHLLNSRHWTPDADVRPPTIGDSSRITANLKTHARLEAQLVPSGTVANTRFDDWSELRAAAVAIGEYYTRLVEQINSGQGNSSGWDLIAVDHRDASDVVFKSVGAYPATYLKRPEFKLVNSPAPSISLQAHGQDLNWSFRNTTGANVTAEVQYDPNVIVVYDASEPDPTPIEPSTTLSVVNGQSASNLTVHWQVHPKVPKREKPITAELKCRFEAGDQVVVETITLTQGVNDVDLLAYHVTAGNALMETPQSLVVLKPYPNRPSQFRLELRNRSDQQKTVSARLARIPLTAVTPGRLADESFQVLPEIQRRVVTGDQLSDWAEIVAETVAPITLPANAAQPLVLAPPGSAQASNEGETKSATEQPSATPTEEDVTYGLVCEISEASEDDTQPTRWLKWIEIRPLEPNDYLTAHPLYDGITEEFTATVQSRGSLFPRQPRLDGKLVSVRWDTSPLPKRPQKLIGGGDLKHPEDNVSLRGQLERPASIWLNVDDYPRALLYEIRASGRRDDGPTAAAVRIVSLAHAGFPKVYVRRGMMDDLRPALAEGQRYVEFETGGLTPFPQLDSPVTMRFQVDALPSSFGPDDLGQDNQDMVQINLGDDLATYYDDRQISTKLTDMDQDKIVLNCQVTDYVFPIDDLDMSAAERLQVEVKIDGALRATDHVQFIFDQTEPEFDVTIPQTAQTGQSIPIRVIAKSDESGIDRIAVGYVDRREDPLLKAITRETARASIRLKAPPEDGEYLVKVVVTNGALLSSERVFRVRVDPKPEKTETPPPPPKYTVKGIVQIGSNFKRDIKVTFKGQSVVTTDDGTFSFSGLDGGDAKLTATAKPPGLNRTYYIEKEISLPLTGPDKVIDVGELKLERK